MKILVADDDPISRRLLMRVLDRWGYEVVVCSDGKEALWRLVEQEIQLAILDWKMPEMDGMEVCRKIRSTPGTHAYLVLLSARSNQEDLIAGLESGADDFIRKPFDAAELRARLNIGRRILDLEQSLRAQAIRDPLTGLYNRRYMEETLHREISRAIRKGTDLGVILVDIDHFKQINDTYGHQAGDQVLRVVGQFMLDSFRLADIVCRFGGEEFVVILPEVSTEITRNRAEQLREGITNREIFFKDVKLVPVYLSAGIAEFPLHGNTAEELLHKADQALYIAKAEGRNRVVLWSNPESPRVSGLLPQPR
jgi:diguanylate cyclase (GGDEF)-like protein